MPSPVGHALAGVASGWAVARPAAARRALLIQTSILALLAIAPDLDLLINRHSRETHSLGAAAIVASVAAWRRWPIASNRCRIWCAAFAAWASHPVLDMLAPDHAPPIGVMFFWPFSRQHFLTGLEIFLPISRSFQRWGAIKYDLYAAARETLIVAPVTVMTWWVRRRSQRTTGGS